MAAINFPSSPTLGQKFVGGGKTYTYNGTGWVASIGTSTPGLTYVQTTAPSSPNNGDVWIDSNTMTQYAYYNDGNTSQWVEVANNASPAMMSGTFATRPTASTTGVYYFATDLGRLYLDTGTAWQEVASGTGSVTSAMIADGTITTTDFASSVGNFGAWTSYTPTLTQSATVTKNVNSARYAQIGKVVFVNFYLSITGSGTTNNAIRVGLPVTGSTGGTAFLRIGYGILSDVSTTTAYNGTWYMASSTTIGLIGDWSGSDKEWGTNPNLALASGDELHGTLIYEAA